MIKFYYDEDVKVTILGLKGSKRVIVRPCKRVNGGYYISEVASPKDSLAMVTSSIRQYAGELATFEDLEAIARSMDIFKNTR
jgi:hypothetical protein